MFFSVNTGAYASTAGDIFVNVVSRLAYDITKYTLKTAWGITKGTAKGVKDAFFPSKKAKPAPKKVPQKQTNYPEYEIKNNTLPPPPDLDF